MDFDDTPEEAAFRQEVNTWLTTAAKELNALEIDHSDHRVRSKAWQRIKFDGHFANITWPEELGGRGGTPMQQVIYNQEEDKFDTPGVGAFMITFGMCLPTMLAYATEEQKQEFVPKALRGEHIWCQLFSEPSAGSDVAGIRTRSERDGDDWIINGQKIWTSGAKGADYGVLLTRSNPNVPKHKGLTYFFLDMKSPGIEVRPIKQISGASGFNEVYFTDVRIPDAQRLGEVEEGWKVALTTLMNERLSIGSSVRGLGPVDVLNLARKVELEDGPAVNNQAVRERIADFFIKSEGIRYTVLRNLTALSKGDTPGPESSAAKAVSAPMAQELTAFLMDLQGMGGVVRDEDIASTEFTDAWLGAPGNRVAGGTDEIMRNILAERVLGLPGDVRVDKTTAFNELPKGR